MISEKELKYLRIYLRPFKYRCISKGKRIQEPSLLEDMTEEGSYEFGLEDYDLSDFQDSEMDSYFLNKIWFEIVGMSYDFKEKHIGYITGYYIKADELRLDMRFQEGSNSYFELDNNSHLTSELWHHIRNFKNSEFLSNFYFMNSITLDTKYNLPIIEEAAINLIQDALLTIYEYKIRTIIYSIGMTELDDFTISDNYEDIDEFSFERHRKNMLRMGFKSYKDNNEEIYLYKNDLDENLV